MLNQSSNIPGMLAEFKDGGLVLRRQAADPGTSSVLLIGTAIDGPVMTPVAVDIDSAEAIFGKSTKSNGHPNGSTLPEAFSQAYKEGCRDIRMMRISGSKASLDLACSTINDSTIEIKREVLGNIGGNEEMVFVINHINVIAPSIELYAAGKKVDSSALILAPGLTTTSVTLKANRVTVGSDIMIKYKYHTMAPLLSTGVVPVIDGQDEISLDHTPINGITGINNIKVMKDSVVLAIGTDYIVETLLGNSKVKFTSPLLVTSIIDLEFSYYPAGDVPSPYVSQNSNSVGGIIWVAVATDPQEFLLAETPIANDFKLYVDNKEIFNESVYDVDYINKKLLINKKFFALGKSVEFAYNYQFGEVVTPIMNIETSFGGELYNEAKVLVKNIVGIDGVIVDKELVLTKPLSKRVNGNELPLVYKCSSFKTLNELAFAINNDSKNNTFVVSIEEDFEMVDSNTLIALAERNLEGGDNGLGLSKQQMFEQLSGKKNSSGAFVEAGAYRLLQNYKVDYVVPLGVYADDTLLGKYDNFAEELALFCGIMSQLHLHMTHGVISTKPPKKTGLIDTEAYVAKLMTYPNIYLMRSADGTPELDNEGKAFDMGGYISVIAGQEIISSSARMGVYNDNASIKYAALLSRLPAGSAPTNKKLESALGLKLSYSIPQLNKLAENRFVTFNNRISDNFIVPTDGVTAAKAGSDYSRVVHSKIIRECLSDIYKVAEPFIGEPINTATTNALSAGIDKKLSIRANPVSGSIAAYEFRFDINDEMLLFGDTRIELTLVPYGERRRITVVVGLKPSL